MATRSWKKPPSSQRPRYLPAIQAGPELPGPAPSSASNYQPAIRPPAMACRPRRMLALGVLLPGSLSALADRLPEFAALIRFAAPSNVEDSVKPAGAVTGFGLATRAVSLPAGRWMCAERTKTSLGVSRRLADANMPRHEEQSSGKVFGRQGGETSIKPAKNTGLMSPWGTEVARFSCRSISSCRPGRSAKLNAP